MPGGAPKLTFRIDPGKTPKELDLRNTAKGKMETWRAIYKIDGDTLTVCQAEDSTGARPKAFKATKGVILTVFKRRGK